MRQPRPPRLPLRLLRFFLKADYLEEIEGDMEEIFHEQVQQHSLAKARSVYTWEMIKLLRPILLKQFSSIPVLQQFTLFKNYSKVSVRGLLKNPLSAFINIFGLSFAIGISILVYAFMSYDQSVDQFHENKDHVFLTTFFADREGSVQQYGTSPRPLGEMMKQDFAQIKNMCRIEDGNAVVKYEDHVFVERIRFTDPAFLDMFTFPLKWGAPQSLRDPNSIILSEDMAVKYFGEENPVGKELLLIFQGQTKKMFEVTGVAAAFPKAHDIDFNFLIHFDNVKASDTTYRDSDWSQFLNATLIQVDKPEDIQAVASGMEKYKTLQNEVQHNWPIKAFAFEPLATLFKQSANIKDCISQDGNVEGRIGMPIIAIFMLILACLNYINIAIVSAAKRLKEIGVRKVIGASRGKVITQFLTENIVITFFAAMVGLLLGMFIFTPWFTQFSGWPLEVKLVDRNLWIFLLLLLLFTGISSGIYPAFYISKFAATRIFKGSLEFGRKNPLTKVFLGIQLILACITISAGIVFTQNNTYQRNRSWGYNQQNALYLRVPDQTSFNQMRLVMEQEPDVLHLAGSTHHLGKSTDEAIIRIPPNQQYEVAQLSVDADYFETMELELSDGRGFHQQALSDRQSVVVNELLVHDLNLKDPIGFQFEMDSMRYEIVGVLKNFHNQSFFSKMRPTIFKVAEEKNYHYLSMRVKEGALAKTYSVLQSQWAKHFPEIPFTGGYQEDVWSGYFISLDRSVTFNTIIAFIAVMLASLGLYGLITLNVSGRIREFSIRKTLGAGLHNLTGLMVKQYLWLTVISLLIGAPISYLFTKAYLNMLFSYSMPMGYSGIMLSVFLLVCVLALVVATQIRSVAKANPVSGLKVE